MNLKRKLSLSIITVLFALFTLTTTTFAWFNLTDFGVVDSLELNVSSDRLLFLSVDGKTFKSYLSNEDIKPYIDGVILDAVTSDNSRDFYTKYGELTNYGYISFPIWFRTTAKIYDGIYLSDNLSSVYNYSTAIDYDIEGTYVFSRGKRWSADVTFDNGDKIVTKGESGIYYGANAIRIGVVEEKLEQSLVDEKLYEDTNLITKIFDLSEFPERGFGQNYGAIDRELQQTGMLPKKLTDQHSIAGLSKFINPYEVVDDKSLVATFKEGLNVEEDGYYYAKIRVNIWLEGWDPDCFDAILSDRMLMQLSFKQAMPIKRPLPNKDA